MEWHIQMLSIMDAARHISGVFPLLPSSCCNLSQQQVSDGAGWLINVSGCINCWEIGGVEARPKYAAKKALVEFSPVILSGRVPSLVASDISKEFAGALKWFEIFKIFLLDINGSVKRRMLFLNREDMKLERGEPCIFHTESVNSSTVFLGKPKEADCSLDDGLPELARQALVIGLGRVQASDKLHTQPQVEPSWLGWFDEYYRCRWGNQRLLGHATAEKDGGGRDLIKAVVFVLRIHLSSKRNNSNNKGNSASPEAAS
ncbi:predicted protein [Histoplasma capsulatum var. duboisii H88]|uniref:Predicted protein n=1 Tax=Ajellomyces capsulatus (strain H88) TaxID=544711 RepID=F0U930_AJEC8|nr:predicted protein [Histoplasma capsulatum var. duboisii H88]